MTKTSFSIPRGMRDIEASEMGKRLWIYSRIQKVMQNYGFQMVEPTAIENLETLEAKSGPEIREEIYWFKDKADRNLGLRFDLTVGMTRMVANRFDLSEPIKMYALSEMWRYDEPQFARYRNFYQWDAEIYGSPEKEADAEVICLGIDILEEVGLKEFEIKISNRKLIESFLRRIGLNSKERLENSMRNIDKIKKISKMELLQEFKKDNLASDLIEKIFDFVSFSGNIEKASERIPEIFLKDKEIYDSYTEIVDLMDILKSFKVADKCVIDFSIVRGIGYYDGIVFEAYDNIGSEIGSIFGGGRYDKLCGIYGKREMPATGVAGGIERLILSLEKSSLLPDVSQAPMVYVVTTDDSLREKSWDIAKLFRDEGISADFDLRKRNLKKQLEYANSLNVPYVILIGKKELEKGKVKLKDMKKRQELELSLEDILQKLAHKAE